LDGMQFEGLVRYLRQLKTARPPAVKLPGAETSTEKRAA
jgi:hypothetical protein